MKEIRKGNFGHPRPKYKFTKTEELSKLVYSYAAYGSSYDNIAASMGINQKTLVKYFQDELISGKAMANNLIAQRLYQMAVGKEAVIDNMTGEILSEAIRPSLPALIYLAKVRLGWNEVNVVQSTVEMSSGVQIYLPDNGMTIEAKGEKR